MMQGVCCDKELITERYDYLRKQMSPDAHLSIFPIGSWREPWGLGRENTVEANKVYSEAMISLGFDDEDVKLSDYEYSDQVLFVLRSKCNLFNKILFFLIFLVLNKSALALLFGLF